MAMKILTGQIVPQSKYLSGGTATINFDTHRVDGNATGGVWQQQAEADLPLLLVLFMH
uniref:Uncharacterized protein n=1 Tax=Candidatus Methanophaga sp. ANME-1 ERB7 TaxID=2759913 RepID=A0A7G9Z913_9EURY|nr:hypothetical protein HGIILDEE_00036 [Methanosarcinales archaeon ANME-1 ERB7]